MIFGDMAVTDPHLHALHRIRHQQKEFTWSPGAGADWAGRLRERIHDLTGLPREPRPPLELESEGRQEKDGFSLQTVTYQTRPGLRALAHILVPEGRTEPGPAVVCIPGHGPGVGPIVDDENPDYQAAFAVQAVRAGFVVAAVEQMSFGCRKSAISSDREYSCHPDSALALALGECMVSWRVNDTMAAIDMLMARPDVDPTRVGTMGISGGGTTSFWTACLDTRVAGCVVSGYFNSFFDSIFRIEHCIDNYVPGIAKVVEMPDMAALVCPRPLIVESGTLDDIFPVDSYLQACQRAGEIFADAGVSDRFSMDLFEGDHAFNGRKVVPELYRLLSENPNAAIER